MDHITIIEKLAHSREPVAQLGLLLSGTTLKLGARRSILQVLADQLDSSVPSSVARFIVRRPAAPEEFNINTVFGFVWHVEAKYYGDTNRVTVAQTSRLRLILDEQDTLRKSYNYYGPSLAEMLDGLTMYQRWYWRAATSPPPLLIEVQHALEHEERVRKAARARRPRQQLGRSR